MEPCLLRGERVTVVGRDGAPSQGSPAVVLTDAGHLVSLEFALLYGQPVPFSPGSAVVLVRSVGHFRQACDARVLSVSRPAVWIEVAPEGWREFDAHPAREPASLHCEVSGRAPAAERLPGVIVDASLEALRVVLPRHVGEARLNVSIRRPRGRLVLPCVLLAVVPADDHVELRLRFERLDHEQDETVAELIRSLGAPSRPAAA